MDFSLDIVPVQVDHSAFCSLPVLCHSIVLLQDIDEVVGMVCADVLNPKIIN